MKKHYVVTATQTSIFRGVVEASSEKEAENELWLDEDSYTSEGKGTEFEVREATKEEIKDYYEG